MANTEFNLQGKEYQANPADVQENKVISILCYFGILLLIPYLVKKDSEYVKFHSNQGLILLIVNIALSIVSAVIGAILGLIPYIGGILSGLIGGVISLACFALMIIGIVNAVTGKMKELPIIGGYRILK